MFRTHDIDSVLPSSTAKPSQSFSVITRTTFPAHSMASQTQSALLLTEAGKPLVRSTIPVQDPHEARVQVKISAMSLMPADQKIREGGLGAADTLPWSSSASISQAASSLRRLVPPLRLFFPIGTRVAFQPKFGPLIPLSGGLKEYASADPNFVFRISRAPVR